MSLLYSDVLKILSEEGKARNENTLEKASALSVIDDHIRFLQTVNQSSKIYNKSLVSRLSLKFTIPKDTLIEIINLGLTDIDEIKTLVLKDTDNISDADLLKIIQCLAMEND